MQQLYVQEQAKKLGRWTYCWTAFGSEEEAENNCIMLSRG
jgi:hypothetical protein